MELSQQILNTKDDEAPLQTAEKYPNPTKPDNNLFSCISFGFNSFYTRCWCSGFAMPFRFDIRKNNGSGLMHLFGLNHSLLIHYRAQNPVRGDILLAGADSFEQNSKKDEEKVE